MAIMICIPKLFSNKKSRSNYKKPNSYYTWDHREYKDSKKKRKKESIITCHIIEHGCPCHDLRSFVGLPIPVEVEAVAAGGRGQDGGGANDGAAANKA